MHTRVQEWYTKLNETCGVCRKGDHILAHNSARSTSQYLSFHFLGWMRPHKKPQQCLAHVIRASIKHALHLRTFGTPLLFLLAFP